MNHRRFYHKLTLRYKYAIIKYIYSFAFYYVYLYGSTWEDALMKLFRNIRGFILNHPAVFVAFALLMIVSICSALFTFNFLLNVIYNNEKAFEGESISFAEQYLKEGAVILGVMLISVFNLAYVYTYILDTRKREIAISRISGQTIFSAIATSYAEIFILSTLGYIIGVLIMKFLVLPLLSGRGFMFNDSIDVSQYLMLYLIFILVYSIVFLPSIINQMRKSPVEALTDEG